MKKLVVLFIAILVVSSTALAAYSVEALKTPFNGDLKGIKDINANTVIVVGNSAKIFKTTDNGATWDSCSSGVNSTNFYAVDFRDSNNGVIVGKQGMALFTSNGGLTWVKRQIQSNFDFLSVKFRSSDEVWTVGASGSVFRTTNNGITWDNYSYPSFSGAFTDIDFSASQIWVTSTLTHSVWSSSNNGLNWIGQNPQNVSAGGEICFSGTVGYIAGATASNTGVISRTTNEGLTWISYLPSNCMYMQFINFTSQNNGFAVGGTSSPSLVGQLYTTSNAGNSWNFAQDFPRRRLLGLSCLANDAWICADSGWVYKVSITTGISSQSTVVKDYTLSQNYPNPFNPNTKINFSILKPEHVKLSVFDISGREVSILLNGRMNAGSYTYDFNASNLSSGIYSYRIVTANFTETKKMVLVK